METIIITIDSGKVTSVSTRKSSVEVIVIDYDSDQNTTDIPQEEEVECAGEVTTFISKAKATWVNDVVEAVEKGRVQI